MSENTKPVEAVAVTQTGGTFAERKAAREKAAKAADRAVPVEETDEKAVQSAENKAVGSSESKRPARKK